MRIISQFLRTYNYLKHNLQTTIIFLERPFRKKETLVTFNKLSRTYVLHTPQHMMRLKSQRLLYKHHILFLHWHRTCCKKSSASRIYRTFWQTI